MRAKGKMEIETAIATEREIEIKTELQIEIETCSDTDIPSARDTYRDRDGGRDGEPDYYGDGNTDVQR